MISKGWIRTMAHPRNGVGGGLLDGLGAVDAAGGVVADVGLIATEAAIAGVADGLGDGGDLKGVEAVLVVDGGLVAVGDGEGVACLLSGWRDRRRAPGLRGGMVAPDLGSPPRAERVQVKVP